MELYRYKLFNLPPFSLIEFCKVASRLAFNMCDRSYDSRNLLSDYDSAPYNTIE